MYAHIFAINGVILAALFTISSVGASFTYNLLKKGLNPYFDLFFIFVLLCSLIVFYLCFILLIVLYYRLLLTTISERETICYLNQKGLCRSRQLLRLILTGVAMDLALPLLYYFPYSLRLFGAKVGKDILLRGQVSSPEMIEIGNNVLIASRSYIIGHLRDGNRLTYKKITIADNCTIGVGSLIFPGVKIGCNSIVAAGSIVPKDTRIPENEVWAGIPARKIKDINPLQQI